jgi:drug/metabolite transporter (DMT)-like permease
MDRVSIFLLIIIASLFHAFWNYLSKKANEGIIFIWLIYVLSVIIYIPVMVWQLWSSANSISLPILIIAFVSGIIHLFYFLILQAGYRKSDLSVVYPLARGSGPLLSSIAAILFLNEKTGFYSVAGLLLIVIGVFVITRFKLTTKLNEKLKLGLLYGVGTGFFIAAYTFVDAVGVKKYNASPVLLTFATNLIGSIALLPFISKTKGQIKEVLLRQRSNIAGIVLLNSAGYILILTALKYAPLTIVAPSRELSIVLGVFMGSSFLQEPDFKRRIFASLLIFAGIFCLAVS